MISNKLKSIRTERGMSITELARRSGLSRVTIYNLEKRSITPNLETAMSISKVFGLKVDEIFFSLNVNHELQKAGGLSNDSSTDQRRRIESNVPGEAG